MLTLKKLVNELDLEVFAGADQLEKTISSGYACDLLSLVVSRIEDNSVWLTVLGSINVIAVATLAECPCVLLTEGTTMDERTLQKASEQQLVVLGTGLNTFSAAAAIDRLLTRADNDLPV